MTVAYVTLVLYLPSPSKFLIFRSSALLNGGFAVSRSHASPGSLKTNAPRAFVLDIIREWIKITPVKMENVKDGSPAAKLLAKEQTCVAPACVFLASLPVLMLICIFLGRATVDLEPHPDVEKALMSTFKLVRYQLNPLPNWGPAKAAVQGGGKKKAAAEEEV